MKPTEPLHPHEWNFDKVPDSELVACCWWEYARESTFIRDNVSRGRISATTLAEGGYLVFPESWQVLGKIAGKGATPSVFLQSLPFQPSAIHILPNREAYWPTEKEGRLASSSFPDPWQSLSQKEREGWVVLVNKLEKRQRVPVKLGEPTLARLVIRYWKSVLDKLGENPRAWYGVHVKREENGDVSLVPIASTEPGYEPIRPGFMLTNEVRDEEILTLEIGWGSYTNDEIANYFRKVLPALRPKSVRGPSARGKTRPEIRRAALRSLGVMRLLNFSTVANLKHRCSAAADYFKRLGWLETEREKNFSAARKRALETFRLLYPYLPEAESPLNGRTKGGRAKL